MKRFFNFRNILIGFFLLNLLQAFFTPIAKDEAYYWMFSQNIDWGYFDHPPMVALLIKLGYSLFQNELGVRLMTTILSILTCIILWQLVEIEDREKKNSKIIFLLFIIALPLFNVYGFITTPDAPLLFFSTLYLLVFNRFTVKKSWINTLLVGSTAALLMYSKYHGALVILFALASNISVLRTLHFYLAGIIGLLLFSPHLYWQYTNDFVTFNYHLIHRASGPFKSEYFFNYLLNIFIVLNPVLFVVVVIQWIKKNKYAQIPHQLKWLFWGFIGFFAFNSFRDHVEPHWLAVCSIPMVLSLHKLYLNTKPLQKQLKTLIFISLSLILVLRVFLILPITIIKSEFHYDKKDYYSAIQEIANGEKVAFVNSYQNAAKYTFYTSDSAFSYNCVSSRKNQYDLWDYENNYHNENVYIVGNWPSSWFEKDTLKNGREILFNRAKNFPMINKLKFKLEHPINISLTDTSKFEVTITNPYNRTINFVGEQYPIRMRVYFRKDGKYDYYFYANLNVQQLPPNSTTVASASLFIPQKVNPGNYQLEFTVKPGYLYDVIVSEPIPFKVN